MPFREAVAIAVASLRANKLRSLLTVLGILIGVSSVIAVVAITEGLDRYMSDKVLELGTRSFTIQKFPDVITSREAWVEAMKRKNLDFLDVQAVARACHLCSEVGAVVGTGGSAEWKRIRQDGVRVIGITENISRMGTIRDLESGRHLVDEDVSQARPVVVIGPDIVAAFFGVMDPIGREITLDGHPVKVVGVVEKKGSIFGESQDNFAWIPITTFRKFYGPRRSLTIQAEAASMDVIEEAQDQARVAVRSRRHLDYDKPDDFSVETGQSVMELWKSATQGIYVVTIVVTAISLLVGGIVVMNIMLVSVTERFREIGVRKAMGARRRDILRQFLVESVILTMVGGLLGVGAAALFAMGLAAILGNMMSASFSAPVRLWAIATAVAVSSAVGLVAGIYPASRAARLDPVVALRNEG
jgi:putative ABC transport system permease protein